MKYLQHLLPFMGNTTQSNLPDIWEGDGVDRSLTPYSPYYNGQQPVGIAERLASENEQRAANLGYGVGKAIHAVYRYYAKRWVGAPVVQPPPAPVSEPIIIKPATYDIVHFWGPGINPNYLEDVKKAYEGQNIHYHILGDGINPITREQIDGLKGNVDSHTEADILGHGMLDKTGIEHYITLTEQPQQTADFINYLAKMGIKTLRVRSCYADIRPHLLVPGLNLMIYGHPNKQVLQVDLRDDILDMISHYPSSIPQAIERTRLHSPEEITVHYNGQIVQYRAPRKLFRSLAQAEEHFLSVIADSEEYHHEVAENPVNNRSNFTVTQEMVDRYVKIDFNLRLLHAVDKNTPLLTFSSKYALKEISEFLTETGINPDSLEYGHQRPTEIALTNAPVLKVLLDAGANPNLERNTYTLLYQAVDQTAYDSIEVLLNAHADPHIRNMGGHSPLDRAIGIGDEKSFHLLLSKMTLKSSDNYIACAYALMQQNPHFLTTLLKNRAADSFDIDYVLFGMPLLHFAVEKKAYSGIEQLIKAGSGHQIKDNKGRTALHKAIDENDMRAFNLLLPGTDLRDDHGYMIMGRAISSPNGAFIVPLLSKVDIHFTPRGSNPLLHVAVEARNEYAVLMFVRNGANIQAHNIYGKVAVLKALENGDNGIIDALLPLTNFEGNQGVEAIRYTIAHRNTAHLAMILEKKVNPNLLGSHFQQPLFTAFYHNDAESARMLIKAGAISNRNQIQHFSIFLYAVERGNTKMVQVFIDGGTDIHEKTRDGLSAVDVARNAGHHAMVKLLRDAIKQQQKALIPYQHPTCYRAHVTNERQSNAVAYVLK